MSDAPVSSTTADKAAAARRGEPTAPAVTAVARPRQPWRPTPPDRVETYEATAPDGSQLVVEHNIDTGESKTRAAD